MNLRTRSKRFVAAVAVAIVAIVGGIVAPQNASALGGIYSTQVAVDNSPHCAWWSIGSVTDGTDPVGRYMKFLDWKAAVTQSQGGTCATAKAAPVGTLSLVWILQTGPSANGPWTEHNRQAYLNGAVLNNGIYEPSSSWTMHPECCVLPGGWVRYGLQWRVKLQQANGQYSGWHIFTTNTYAIQVNY